MKRLTKGIKTNQTNIKALDQVIAGYKLMQEMKFAEAVKSFKKALRSKPNFGDAHSAKGRVFLQLGRYEEALKAFDKAIELDPNQYFPYLQKGKIFQFLERYDEAITMYDQALSCSNINIFTTQTTMLLKVEVLGEQKKWDVLEVILDDRKLSEVWEEFTATHHLLYAKCAYGKGEYAKALAYCDE